MKKEANQPSEPTPPVTLAEEAMTRGLSILLKRAGFAVVVCWPAAFALAYFQPLFATLAFVILALLLFGPTLFIVAPAVVTSSKKHKGASILFMAIGACTAALFQIHTLEESLHRSAGIQFLVIWLLSFAVAAGLNVLRPLTPYVAHKKEESG